MNETMRHDERVTHRVRVVVAAGNGETALLRTQTAVSSVPTADVEPGDAPASVAWLALYEALGGATGAAGRPEGIELVRIDTVGPVLRIGYCAVLDNAAAIAADWKREPLGAALEYLTRDAAGIDDDRFAATLFRALVAR